MSKHTPGPWKIEPYDDTGGYDCITGGIHIGTGDRLSALVRLDAGDYGQHHGWDKDQSSWDRGRMEADARLIAAAPELLAALLAALAGDQGWPLMAMDAVAKVEGHR